MPIIGKHSMYETTNENGHLREKKYISPNNKTMNQISISQKIVEINNRKH